MWNWWIWCKHFFFVFISKIEITPPRKSLSPCTLKLSGFGRSQQEAFLKKKEKEKTLRPHKACVTFTSSAGSCHLLCGTRLHVSSNTHSLLSLTHLPGCCSTVDSHRRPTSAPLTEHAQTHLIHTPSDCSWTDTSTTTEACMKKWYILHTWLMFNILWVLCITTQCIYCIVFEPLFFTQFEMLKFPVMLYGPGLMSQICNRGYPALLLWQMCFFSSEWIV